MLLGVWVGDGRVWVTMAAEEHVWALQERVLLLSDDGKADELQMVLVDHPELDVDECKDYSNETALHCACRKGHAACAQLLVDHKANVNWKDNYDANALYYAS